MKKTVIAILVGSLFMGGCQTVNPTTGKTETNAGQTAAAAGAVGGVIGALLGGKKGALIGAALGGGAGYLYGLDAQKKELEQAKLAAAEIHNSPETSYLKPVVYTQDFQDVKSGQKAEGLKSIDVSLPIHEMTNKQGALTDKGEVALLKLQAAADRMGGSMDIIVPRNIAPSTYKALVKAVPRAQMVVASGNEKTVKARINGKPVDASSGIRLASA